MMRGRAVLVAASAFLTSGCATILGGKTQTITVNSNVSGAEVLLNEAPLGKTPLTTSLKRGQSGVLRVQAAGYQPYQIAINKKISTLFWVNIFTGGVFGSSTDYSTGAMYEYEPATFMASLSPVGRSDAELSEWRRREGLRGFVLLNSDAIVSELALGRGESVDVLLRTFSVPEADRAGAIERWRQDYRSSTTAADFAARVITPLR